MKSRKGAVIALLLLATCSQEDQPTTPPELSPKLALGTIPASEVAVWQKVGTSSVPDGRFLQAAAFDSARKVVVMFGGTKLDTGTGSFSPTQETWEWDPATGKWTNRTGTGTAPSARSGAGLVYDSKRAKMVLFGGRAGSGYNYEDTWEWDPTTGAWTDLTNAGSHPSARSQPGMVYEASTGKVLLFGGGRSDPGSYDGTGVTVSLGDTWELDPATHAWTSLAPTSPPTARHDMGLVWDTARSKAVLFGGMQADVSGIAGVAKQDTWDWDPAAGTWTERTNQGTKPTPRYAHSMAYDGSRSKVLVFGGFDMATGGSLNDLWEWDPTSGAWTQRLTGSETGMPTQRRYASLISDDARGRLELVAGESLNSDPYGRGGTGGIIIIGPGPMPPVYYGTSGTREIWELDPAKPAFTNRTAVLDVPTARTGHAMAYFPPTAKTYLFGGMDQMTGQYLGDLWAWDGSAWSQIAGNEAAPAGSYGAALAYDPARKSLILYGGNNNSGYTSDTWEWTPAKGWAQLSPAANPGALYGHAMVTDSTRSKILLFGGLSMYKYTADAGPYPPYYRPTTMTSDVWEWDGAAATWTDRSLITSGAVPSGRQNPGLTYDEGRKKLFLYEGTDFGRTMGSYWEWDPISAGWTLQDTGDATQKGYSRPAAYDSIRRRHVIVAQSYDYYGTGTNQDTWEIDAATTTLFDRTFTTSPGPRSGSAMVFDSGRGVMVLFSGQPMNGGVLSNDTWEYKVTGLGNGEGCTAASASTCATGYCVDGVCCESASCSGPCKACNVPGSQGTCVAVKAGTEVPGSCANGQACDGNGNCLARNGDPCSSGTSCASGACVDGVCCDTSCTGTCMACNQPGLVGKCSPYPAGSDPQTECGGGTGVCKATCNGSNGCAYPQRNVTCGTCMLCDGAGTCSTDPFCGGYGGKPYPYSTGGRPYPYGSGGYPYPYGSGGYPYASGGYPYGAGGAAGSPPGSGGRPIPSGGVPYPTGGSGGASGGRGGGLPTGGTAGYPARGGAGGLPPGFGGMAVSGGSSGSSAFGGFGYGGSFVGAGGKADAGPTGVGGKRDGAPSDAAEMRTHLHAGCSCDVGQATQGATGSASLLMVALGLLWLRKRRRPADRP